MAWLEGAERPTRQARGLASAQRCRCRPRARRVRARVAEIDRKAFDGRFAYTYPAGNTRAKLDVALSAAEFDIEAAYSFVKTAMAGSKLERPGEVALAVDLGRTSFAGITATGAKANLRYDSGGVRIERLAVGDFGGAALSPAARSTSRPRSPRATSRSISPRRRSTVSPRCWKKSFPAAASHLALCRAVVAGAHRRLAQSRSAAAGVVVRRQAGNRKVFARWPAWQHAARAVWSSYRRHCGTGEGQPAPRSTCRVRGWRADVGSRPRPVCAGGAPRHQSHRSCERSC